MEFNEKLQELRKRRGLTQEELAAKLYVSRTAVSKWESGRGYPGIESLKAIALFFGVTVDELISSDKILELAEQDAKQKRARARTLEFGIIDICMALLLFLPFFAQRDGEEILSVSLLALGDVQDYLLITYFALVAVTAAWGILTLALQGCEAKTWAKAQLSVSLALGAASLLVFAVSLQPYAAVFGFVLLALKVLILIKSK